MSKCGKWAAALQSSLPQEALSFCWAKSAGSKVTAFAGIRHGRERVVTYGER